MSKGNACVIYPAQCLVNVSDDDGRCENLCEGLLSRAEVRFLV